MLLTAAKEAVELVPDAVVSADAAQKARAEATGEEPEDAK